MQVDRHRGRWACIALVLTVGLAADAGAQEIRLGRELQLNSYTVESQSFLALAAGSDGDFVAVWSSNYHQDGSLEGVFAQRFSSSGVTRGVEFRVNAFTQNGQGGAAAAAADDGDFVVVWTSGYQDGSSGGVFGRRFSSAGSPRGAELQVNTYTFSGQELPVVAAEDNGDFVVVWTSFSQDGHYSGIFGRRFSSAGAALASEFQVNSHTIHEQRSAAIAADADGDFVVVWQSHYQGGAGGLFAQRFSSSGVARGSELEVSIHTLTLQRRPAIASDEDGDFVVVWNKGLGEDFLEGTFARRFSSAGDVLGGELQVNTHTHRYPSYPSVGVKPDGDFVVAWNTISYYGYLQDVFARRFSSSGVGLGDEFRVNTYTPWQQFEGKVLVQDDRHFVVGWTSYRRDGSRFGVFAQRFAAPIALDADGNDATAALTDGLLVLRYLFGLRGSSLASGAVDLFGCTRCGSGAIASYLAGLGVLLDIDGDGELQPLTDGLLALRYQFGFRGALLTGGAVDFVGCTRCDAAAIEGHLEELTI